MIGLSCYHPTPKPTNYGGGGFLSQRHGYAHACSQARIKSPLKFPPDKYHGKDMTFVTTQNL